MESFLIKPNLPLGPVSVVMLGDIYIARLFPQLDKLKIRIIPIPENLEIAKPVRFHADMSVHHISGGRFVVSKGIYDKILNELLSIGIEPIKGERKQSEIYPFDISLNSCRIGNKLFHKLKYTDRILINELGIQCVDFINTEQGYTKCSVCIVDEFSAITSDGNIAEKLKFAGIDTLLINEGYIDLPGYKHGFIGGATGKLSENLIAFTGHLKRHPDEGRILDFLKKKNVIPVYLTDEPCFDIGSIIPVKQYD